MLRSKLVERKLEEQRRELEELRGEQQEIGWGSHIALCLPPYQMVKAIAHR